MVQRVGYRCFVLESAQEMGIVGYVQNEKDGSVTVFAQGQEGAVSHFLVVIGKPPRGAVKEVERVAVAPDPSLSYFEIKFGSVQEELQEGFGGMESEFRDYREDFGNYREEFRDYRKELTSFAERTDENFRIMSERYGEISAKLTVILETLIKESRETREMLNETMKMLRAAVEKLSK